MTRLKLTINKNSRNIPDDLDSRIYDLSMNGIEVIPKMEEFPMPWDAGCYIEDGFFIIDGDLGQQGSHRGYAKVGIPLDKVSNYIDLYVSPERGYDEQSNLDELKTIFDEYGWVY